MREARVARYNSDRTSCFPMPPQPFSLYRRTNKAPSYLPVTELIAGPARDKVSRPARRGEVIEIYCTGLGPVSNPPAAGSPATDSLSSTLGNTIVTVGTVRARGVVFGPRAKTRWRLPNQRQDSTRRASGRSRAAIGQCQRTRTRKQHGNDRCSIVRG